MGILVQPSSATESSGEILKVQLHQSAVTRGQLKSNKFSSFQNMILLYRDILQGREGPKKCNKFYICGLQLEKAETRTWVGWGGPLARSWSWGGSEMGRKLRAKWFHSFDLVLVLNASYNG